MTDERQTNCRALADATQQAAAAAAAVAAQDSALPLSHLLLTRAAVASLWCLAVAFETSLGGWGVGAQDAPFADTWLALDWVSSVLFLFAALVARSLVTQVRRAPQAGEAAAQVLVRLRRALVQSCALDCLVLCWSVALLGVQIGVRGGVWAVWPTCVGLLAIASTTAAPFLFVVRDVVGFENWRHGAFTGVHYGLVACAGAAVLTAVMLLRGPRLVASRILMEAPVDIQENVALATIAVTLCAVAQAAVWLLVRVPGAAHVSRGAFWAKCASCAHQCEDCVRPNDHERHRERVSPCAERWCCRRRYALWVGWLALCGVAATLLVVLVSLSALAGTLGQCGRDEARCLQLLSSNVQFGVCDAPLQASWNWTDDAPPAMPRCPHKAQAVWAWPEQDVEGGFNHSSGLVGCTGLSCCIAVCDQVRALLVALTVFVGCWAILACVALPAGFHQASARGTAAEDKHRADWRAHTRGETRILLLLTVAFLIGVSLCVVLDQPTPSGPLFASIPPFAEMSNIEAAAAGNESETLENNQGCGSASALFSAAILQALEFRDSDSPFRLEASCGAWRAADGALYGRSLSGYFSNGHIVLANIGFCLASDCLPPHAIELICHLQLSALTVRVEWRQLSVIGSIVVANSSVAELWARPEFGAALVVPVDVDGVYEIKSWMPAVPWPRTTTVALSYPGLAFLQTISVPVHTASAPCALANDSRALLIYAEPVLLSVRNAVVSIWLAVAPGMPVVPDTELWICAGLGNATCDLLVETVANLDSTVVVSFVIVDCVTLRLADGKSAQVSYCALSAAPAPIVLAVAGDAQTYGALPVWEAVLVWSRDGARDLDLHVRVVDAFGVVRCWLGFLHADRGCGLVLGQTTDEVTENGGVERIALMTEPECGLTYHVFVHQFSMSGPTLLDAAGAAHLYVFERGVFAESMPVPTVAASNNASGVVGWSVFCQQGAQRTQLNDLWTWPNAPPLLTACVS